jgi:hypothetical protein
MKECDAECFDGFGQERNRKCDCKNRFALSTLTLTIKDSTSAEDYWEGHLLIELSTFSL